MKNKKDYPILEFDESLEAVLEPSRLIEPLEGISKKCVITFFKEVIDYLVEENNPRLLTEWKYEGGVTKVFEIEYEGEKVVITNCVAGAAFAGALLDELIALGCKAFIACGGCGVLIRNTEVGQLFIPTSGVRDEGLSYHYLPPSREVEASSKAVEAIEATLNENKIPFRLSKTWTTDAIYRETRDKVTLRVSEGCETVEMEFTAFAAVAKFRGVAFGQILYSGDDLSGEVWDGRKWKDRKASRREIVNLAIESCLKI